MKLLSKTPRIIKAYLLYTFSWINMQAKTEDMCVTKLVGHITKIPKHLDLYFSNFSMNFQVFSKFSLETKGKGLESCRQAPRKKKVLANRPLAGVRAERGV